MAKYLSFNVNVCFIEILSKNLKNYIIFYNVSFLDNDNIIYLEKSPTGDFFVSRGKLKKVPWKIEKLTEESKNV